MPAIVNLLAKGLLPARYDPRTETSVPRITAEFVLTLIGIWLLCQGAFLVFHDGLMGTLIGFKLNMGGAVYRTGFNPADMLRLAIIAGGEEIVFRVAPISLMLWCTKLYLESQDARETERWFRAPSRAIRAQWAVLVACQVGFAYIHKYNFAIATSPWSDAYLVVMLAPFWIMGFSFAYAYMRFGLLGAVAAHAGWNWIIYLSN
jgi:hypothetical protein